MNAGILFLFLVAFLTTPLTGAVETKPNIVFILADDLGWADLGCYGSVYYETPNLDRLAKQGMLFTDAYAACSVCSPTRASILTGKYPARLHLTDWLPGRGNKPDQKLNQPDFIKSLPLSEQTISKSLKAGGYVTAFIGKWHLGESPACWPQHQGFDLNIAGNGYGHPLSYFSPYGLPNLTDGPKGEYLNDRLTHEALKFIERAKDKPFFLYLSHYAVHTPLQAKVGLIEKYKAKSAALTADITETIVDHGRPVRQVQNHPTYGAMVESMDNSVGAILERIRLLGLEKRTIVVFTSDNGGLSNAEGSPTSNLPLRDGKGWPYEGGIREPLLIKWPGVTQPGGISAFPVISTDYYPTFLEMAGIGQPSDQNKDGQSLVPVLRGETAAQRPLFWHYPHYSNQGGPPNGAVRLGDYKLIEWYEDMRTELYDLKNDPGEHFDLVPIMRGKASELRDMLHHWRAEVKAQMPSPNPGYDPAWKKTDGKKGTSVPKDS